jgi:ABC-type transport system substrate-binding protein
MDLPDRVHRVVRVDGPRPSIGRDLLDDQFVWVPQLAVEQISADRGTWTVNPDNTMDTTWRIHPNIKWHDGALFTSADLAFAFTVYKESGIPTRIASQLRLMQTVAAADPLTLTIHWTNPYAFADQALGLEPMPKHLLEEAWLNDKAGLLSNAALQAGFVGLGPLPRPSRVQLLRGRKSPA